jgi:hypothetical protein
MPAVGTGRTAGEKEQRHDLNDPSDGGDRGKLAKKVADAQSAGVDGRQEQTAVSKHDHKQRSNSGDIDGAVTAGRGVGGNCARNGPGLAERHTDRMPGQGI